MDAKYVLSARIAQQFPTIKPDYEHIAVLRFVGVSVSMIYRTKKGQDMAFPPILPL